MQRMDRTLTRLVQALTLVGAAATLSLTAAWAADRDEAGATAPLQARFEQADRNHDGQLSPAESAAWPNLADHFTEADLDHNGSLSLDEFIKAMQPVN